MPLFHQENRSRNADTRRIDAAFGLAHTMADFIAAFAFLGGSILFFWKAYETQAIWLFVIGSVFFALKPTLRLAREVKLLAMGDAEDLAERYSD